MCTTRATPRRYTGHGGVHPHYRQRAHHGATRNPGAAASTYSTTAQGTQREQAFNGTCTSWTARLDSGGDNKDSGVTRLARSGNGKHSPGRQPDTDSRPEQPKTTHADTHTPPRARHRNPGSHPRARNRVRCSATTGGGRGGAPVATGEKKKKKRHTDLPRTRRFNRKAYAFPTPRGPQYGTSWCHRCRQPPPTTSTTLANRTVRIGEG